MAISTLLPFLPLVLGPAVYHPIASPAHRPSPAPAYRPTSAPAFQPTAAPAYRPTVAPVQHTTGAPVYHSTPAPAYHPRPAEPQYAEHVIHYDHGKEVNEYSASTQCRFEDKITFKDVCIPYTERTCSTQFKEDCRHIPHSVCTGTISVANERACFDVDELICGLKEDVDYETLQEEYYVQLCTIVKERVCDTTFDIAVLNVDDFQCCEVTGHKCEFKEVEIKDITCKETSEFDCQKVAPPEGYGKITQCNPIPIKNCYETPRIVRKEICIPDNTKYCEKFTNAFPQPEQKQNCHFVPKKVCELQRRTRPKKAKKYSYTPDCKVSARTICDQFEKKKVVPACTEDYRRQCDYSPKENCVEESQKYCYKEEVKEQVEICDKLQNNVL